MSLAEFKKRFESPHIWEQFKLLNQDDEFYYFYKHLGIDPKKDVMGIFVNNTLKFSRPTTFNDPFDCHSHIEFDLEGFTENEFVKFTRARKNPLFSPTPIELKKICRNVRLKSKEHKWLTEILEDSRKNIAVCCFNNAPDNILMWSHYADHHTGFMLEFKVSKNYANLIFPYPVIYSEKYPITKISWKSIIDPHLEGLDQFVQLARDSMFVKSEDWKYEREFRALEDLVLNNSPDLLFPFSPSSLTSVVFGLRTSKEDQDLIAKHVNDFNHKHRTSVTTHKTEMASRKYAINILDHPRLSR